MGQAAELLFAGQVVKEAAETGVVTQAEVAPFLITP